MPINSKWIHKETAKGLLHVNFNQDYSHFSVGTDDGIIVYSINPFKQSIKRFHSKTSHGATHDTRTTTNASCKDTRTTKNNTTSKDKTSKMNESSKDSISTTNESNESIEDATSTTSSLDKNDNDTNDPFKLFTNDEKGGFGIVEMLYKTNIIALVGGGLIPKFQTNRFLLKRIMKRSIIYTTLHLNYTSLKLHYT